MLIGAGESNLRGFDCKKLKFLTITHDNDDLDNDSVSIRQ